VAVTVSHCSLFFPSRLNKWQDLDVTFSSNSRIRIDSIASVLRNAFSHREKLHSLLLSPASFRQTFPSPPVIAVFLFCASSRHPPKWNPSFCFFVHLDALFHRPRSFPVLRHGDFSSPSPVFSFFTLSWGLVGPFGLVSLPPRSPF